MGPGVMRVAVRRTAQRIRSAPSSWDGLTQLAVLSACFAAGAVGGFFLSAAVGNNSELLDYLGLYFQSAAQGNGTSPSVGAAVWDLVRWPAIVLLLGLTPFGVVGIPLVMGVRGFLLCYAATTFARLFHLPGMAAALAAFGVTVLIAVPVLFVVAADSFQQSLGRLPGASAPPVHWSQRTVVLAPCAGLLILAVALQRAVMPALFSAVCARLLIS